MDAADIVRELRVRDDDRTRAAGRDRPAVSAGAIPTKCRTRDRHRAGHIGQSDRSPVGHRLVSLVVTAEDGVDDLDRAADRVQMHSAAGRAVGLIAREGHRLHRHISDDVREIERPAQPCAVEVCTSGAVAVPRDGHGRGSVDRHRSAAAERAVPTEVGDAEGHRTVSGTSHPHRSAGIRSGVEVVEARVVERQ